MSETAKSTETRPVVDLLHCNRDRFYSDVEAKPLIVALERRKILKKGDKNVIDSFSEDEEKLKGFMFHRFMEGKKKWNMDVEEFFSILEESGNRNFMKSIQSESRQRHKKCT